MRYKNILKITFKLHKFSLDILRYVKPTATKLSSWKYGNKLSKVLWHLKDNSKNNK